VAAAIQWGSTQLIDRYFGLRHSPPVEAALIIAKNFYIVK
jgi:energy-converting hydrogenase Eha subunit B